jgi:hypothetical protein
MEAALCELDHALTPVTAPPSIVLCQSMQRQVPCVSVLKGQALVLIAAHHDVPWYATIDTDISMAFWAFDAIEV